MKETFQLAPHMLAPGYQIDRLQRCAGVERQQVNKATDWPVMLVDQSREPSYGDWIA
ncbi:hypothetical protein HC891_02835 [Candidatus Gracilibacteria bacterium]|nr:hypothetical protein [Candidatus Gracilibacteria bacterium]